MAKVSLNKVSKWYADEPILQEIDLEIMPGEFVVVVGPSGCGKSSLLRLVAGLDTVSSGEIRINHTCVNQIPAALRDMAMVFQNYALYPHMTVYENMSYALKQRRMAKDEIQKRVESVARLLQLQDYLQRKPACLSGGQRQRVAMGRAIVRAPAVFLFDEPLSNLDAQLRTEMRYEIKKLHKQLKSTCLYVTHDQTEAMTMADKVVVLNKGKIEQFGTPYEIYHKPASLFVAGFMGHYPMNIFDVSVDAQNFLHTALSFNVPLPKSITELPTGSIVLGIRPEHMGLEEPSHEGAGQQGILVDVECIDDMGSDKLFHVITEQGQRLKVRVLGDRRLNDSRLMLTMEWPKASLFCRQTGKRLGGWNDE